MPLWSRSSRSLLPCSLTSLLSTPLRYVPFRSWVARKESEQNGKGTYGVWERAKRERADCFRRTVVILSSRYLSVRSFHPARSIMSGSVSLCSPSPSIPSRAGGTEVRWQGTEVNWWLGPTSHVLRSPSSSITSVLCHAFSTPPLLLTSCERSEPRDEPRWRGEEEGERRYALRASFGAEPYGERRGWEGW